MIKIKIHMINGTVLVLEMPETKEGKNWCERFADTEGPLVGIVSDRNLEGHPVVVNINHIVYIEPYTEPVNP